MELHSFSYLWFSNVNLDHAATAVRLSEAVLLILAYSLIQVFSELRTISLFLQLTLEVILFAASRVLRQRRLAKNMTFGGAIWNL